MNNLIKQATACDFEVYIAERGTYGFYTDGKRIVSFQCERFGGITVYGNCASSRESCTGWQIITELDDTTITPDMVKSWLVRNSPSWANKNPVYTTREQYLACYGASSKYRKVS